MNIYLEVNSWVKSNNLFTRDGDVLALRQELVDLRASLKVCLTVKISVAK